MKIRIKSNYLTRYVLQDCGNIEPLLTFTSFVFVLYFIYYLFCFFSLSHTHTLPHVRFLFFLLSLTVCCFMRFPPTNSLFGMDMKIVGLFLFVIFRIHFGLLSTLSHFQCRLLTFIQHLSHFT